MKTTKGGLVPAKLINLNNNEEVHCMFNPHEYTLSKSNSWTSKPNIGRNSPQSEFKQGSAQKLTLNLHFDAHESAEDVRQVTDPLWKMMMVDDSKKNKDTNKHEPPYVAFEWGSFYFEAAMISMTQKFTMFSQDGTPLRCEVNLTLEEKIDKLDYKDGGVSVLLAKTASEVVAKASDRVDNLAEDSTGNDLAKKIREFMRKNNIDDPLNIPSGTKFEK